jgi:hypothetical protein
MRITAATKAGSEATTSMAADGSEGSHQGQSRFPVARPG